ncbi:MAG: hypothetical protein ACI9Y1_002340 [Lentisphaeria bacterium]
MFLEKIMKVMPIVSGAIFAVLCLSTASVRAMTTEGSVSGDRPAVGNERILHGDFVALGSDRKLATSVGRYNLPDAASIIDRRNNTDGQAKVTIRFRGDLIVEVTIY